MRFLEDNDGRYLMCCNARLNLDDPLDNVCDHCGKCFNSSGQSVTPSWECDEQGNPYEEP